MTQLQDLMVEQSGLRPSQLAERIAEIELAGLEIDLVGVPGDWVVFDAEGQPLNKSFTFIKALEFAEVWLWGTTL